MADSTSAQHETIISRAAAEQARAIFYKIETLVYEAVRTEVDHEIEAAINAHFANSAAHNTPHRNDDNNDVANDSIAAHSAEFAAIGHLIAGYVIEVIEQEAPAIITKTLAKALRAPRTYPPDNKGGR